MNEKWAILFALASLLCAAVNDFLFKLYARKRRPVGIYVAIIGLVWAAVFAALGQPAALAATWRVTLFWGVLSGGLGVLANLLFIQTLSRHEVGTCATIYRLNLAPAAILAVVLLAETVSWAKVGGVSAAVVAVLLFSNGIPRQETFHLGRGFGLVVSASLLRAGMGVTYKCGLVDGADPYWLLTLNGLLWLAGGLVYHAFFVKERVPLTRETWWYGAGSGVFVCGIVLFVMLALQRGEASVVLPISQLSFCLTSLLGALLLREAVTGRKIAGTACAISCIVLLTINL